MNIGEVVRRTGCSARSIRHYEKAGLLTSHRRPNGYRDFGEEVIAQVMQVARYIRLGFTLEEISTFPGCMLRRVTHSICPDALALHRKRLAEYDQQLLELAHRRERLARALDANGAASLPDMGVSNEPS